MRFYLFDFFFQVSSSSFTRAEESKSFHSWTNGEVSSVCWSRTRWHRVSHTPEVDASHILRPEANMLVWMIVRCSLVINSGAARRVFPRPQLTVCRRPSLWPWITIRRWINYLLSIVHFPFWLKTLCRKDETAFGTRPDGSSSRWTMEWWPRMKSRVRASLNPASYCEWNLLVGERRSKLSTQHLLGLSVFLFTVWFVCTLSSFKVVCEAI